jgi:hypothetical protein
VSSVKNDERRRGKRLQWKKSEKETLVAREGVVFLGMLVLGLKVVKMMSGSVEHDFSL